MNDGAALAPALGMGLRFFSWLVALLVIGDIGCGSARPGTSPRPGAAALAEHTRVRISDARTQRVLATLDLDRPRPGEDGADGVRTTAVLLGEDLAPVRGPSSYAALTIDERSPPSTLAVTLSRVRDQRELRAVFEQAMWRRVRTVDQFLGAPPRPMPAEVRRRIASLVQRDAKATFLAEPDGDLVASLVAALPQQAPLRVEVWLSSML
jgi:hypothetical protein